MPPGAKREQAQGTGMRLIFRLVLFLAVAGGVALAVFAYVGDLSPAQTEHAEPIRIELR